MRLGPTAAVMARIRISAGIAISASTTRMISRFIKLAAQVAGEQAGGHADTDRDADRDEHDLPGDSGAEYRAAQDIAAE